MFDHIFPGVGPIDTGAMEALKGELSQGTIYNAPLFRAEAFPLLMAAARGAADPLLDRSAVSIVLTTVQKIGKKLFGNDGPVIAVLADLCNAAWMKARFLDQDRKDLDAITIRTFKGKLVNVFNADPETLDIEDIAHALGQQCRFSGHTGAFYSVAQHSVLVSRAVLPGFALAGLLHDAAEAYLMDLPSPIKSHPWMEAYCEAETLLQGVIARKFVTTWPTPVDVHRADRELLKLEQSVFWGTFDEADSAKLTLDQLSSEGKFRPLDPEDAETLFLDRYVELKNSAGAAVTSANGDGAGH